MDNLTTILLGIITLGLISIAVILYLIYDIRNKIFNFKYTPIKKLNTGE